MRFVAAPLLLLAGLSCAPVPAIQHDDEIDRLIRLLSDPDIAVRDDAEARLRVLGDRVADRVAGFPKEVDAEAAGRLQRVLLQPASSSLEVIANASMSLAERFYQSGDYERAEAHCRHALEARPDFTAAHALLTEIAFISRCHGRIR